MYLYVFVAHLVGVKRIIYHVHSTSNPNRSRKEIIKETFLSKLFRRIPARNIGRSKEACDSVFKDRKYTVINNGIDIERFKFNPSIRDITRKKLGYDNCFLIGQVGRFSPQKNQLFTLKVINRLKKNKNIKCILIGEGEDKQKIREYITSNALDEKVKILSPCENIEDYYQAMDLFVFPSIFEGFGIVALEAQVSGLPMLCSEVIIEDVKLSETVETILLNDIDKWVERIEQLSIETLTKKRTQRCRDSAKACETRGYSFDTAAKKLNALYEDLTNA